MSAAAAAVTAPTDAPKKKGKLPILIAAAVIGTSAAGGGAWFYLKKQNADEPVEEVKKKAPPVFVNMEPFIVNLADRGHFAQAGLVFEVENEHVTTAMTESMPIIRSRILMLLSSKTADELTTPEGKAKLFEELLAEARAPLHGDEKHAKLAMSAKNGKDAKEEKDTKDAHEVVDTKGVVAVHISSLVIQ